MIVDARMKTLMRMNYVTVPFMNINVEYSVELFSYTSSAELKFSK